MENVNCSHRWTIVHIKTGFIVTENCFHCNKTSTSFCAEDNPPLEEHKEGDHYWNVMETAQSIQFDLECDRCHKVVDFSELAGLMLCTGCDENCPVEKVRSKLEKDHVWIYVACGFLPIKEAKPLSKEKISILEDYFNQRRKSSKSSIKIISYKLVKDLKRCYGEIIKDVGMLSLKPPEFL